MKENEQKQIYTEEICFFFLTHNWMPLDWIEVANL